MIGKFRVRILTAFAALVLSSPVLAAPSVAAPLEVRRPTLGSVTEIVGSLLARLWDAAGNQIDPNGAPLAPEGDDGAAPGGAGNQIDPDGVRATDEEPDDR